MTDPFIEKLDPAEFSKWILLIIMFLNELALGGFSKDSVRILSGFYQNSERILNSSEDTS